LHKSGEVTGDWKQPHGAYLAFLFYAKYFTGDQREEDEMGGACGMHGGKEERTQAVNRAT